MIDITDETEKAENTVQTGCANRDLNARDDFHKGHVGENHSHLNAPCGDKEYSHSHEHVHDGKAHTHAHTHTRISDIHSCLENEFYFSKDKSDIVADDAQSAECRRVYEKDRRDKDALIALGNALCHQMRYNDATEYFDRAVELYPNDYAAHRRRGFCRMAILDTDVAEQEFLWCITRTDDVLDIKYRLACCAYYKGEYGRALELFEECYPLCLDNGAMYVAVVYWDILCRVRLKLDVNAALARYNESVDAGHHIGYLAVIKLFLTGDATLCEELKQDELHLCIYYYGLSLFYEHKGEPQQAKEAFEKAKASDTYFSSFAYLGLYSEYLRNKQ